MVATFSIHCPKSSGVFLLLAVTIVLWTGIGCRGPSQKKSRALTLREALPVRGVPLTGPTLRLTPDSNRLTSIEEGDPIGSFMYFVPLISPNPVTISISSNSNQRARFLTIEREFKKETFSVHCDIEFIGTGNFRDVIDNTDPIRRNEEKLKAGGAMEKQLAYIQIQGSGHGTLDVEGTLTNQIPSVTEIRMHFEKGSGPSPVSIGLCDIRYVGGEFRADNDLIARVNTMTFRPGASRMEVSLGSINREDAGDSLWQKLKGGLVAVAANWFVKPMRIESQGHETMLRFGQALANGDESFTFPHAEKLTGQSVGY